MARTAPATRSALPAPLTGDGRTAPSLGEVRRRRLARVEEIEERLAGLKAEAQRLGARYAKAREEYRAAQAEQGKTERDLEAAQQLLAMELGLKLAEPVQDLGEVLC